MHLYIRWDLSIIFSSSASSLSSTLFFFLLLQVKTSFLDSLFHSYSTNLIMKIARTRYDNIYIQK